MTTTVEREREARLQTKIRQLRRRILSTGEMGRDILPDGTVIRFDMRFHEDKADLYTFVAVKKARRWYVTGTVFDPTGYAWDELLAEMVKDHRQVERLEVATHWEVLG